MRTLRVNQIIAIFLAALTLLGTWLLYKGDFWSLGTEEQKLAAIMEYASADPDDTHTLGAVLHPVLLHDETIGDRRVLTFTDSEIPRLRGHVQFRRGVLGGWQPLEASYAAGPVLSSFRLRDRDVRIVWAADCPPEIVHYKVQANLDEPETLMAEGDVDSPSFFHTYKTDRDYFPELHLYDADGKELDSFDYQAIDDNVPAPGIGSAETNLIYVFCVFLLGLGWVIVRYVWELNEPKKETAL